MIMINIYFNFHENQNRGIFRKIDSNVKVMLTDLDLVNIRQGHLIIYCWKGKLSPLPHDTNILKIEQVVLEL